jgi:TonB-dependent starch-binding outer membrane protein SusC
VQTGLMFAYPSNNISLYSNINLIKDAYSVKEILHKTLADTPLQYWQKDKPVIISIREVSEDFSESVRDGRSIPIQQEAINIVTVSGKITDASTHEPLPGVNVIAKGTTIGTVSDNDGKFSLEVNEADVLVFSFIGFKTIEASLNGRFVIDVSMETDAQVMAAVEVTAGYYNVKEREMIGSISVVKADVIGKQPVTNPLGALIGRMPGVFIQQTTGIPGGDFKIQIRGRNSLRDDGNDPLYIVDGVQISSEKVSSHNASGGVIFGGSSPLTSINPADIESISVLKDADATAIYGSKGANGVVLITTKKGKAGKTKVDVSAYSGIGTVRTQKLLNTHQYLAMRKEAFANDGLTPSADPYDDGSQNKDYRAYAPDLMVWDTTQYTDWQKVLIGGTANTTSAQVSISGGTEETQFLVSTGYFKQTSIFPGNSNYRKLSTHLSLNHRSQNKKFNLNLSVNGTTDANNQPMDDFSWPSRGLAPNAPRLYDDNGNLNWENSTWQNPLAALKNRYEANVNNLITNATLAHAILPGLKIQTRLGLNRIDSKELKLNPSTAYDPAQGKTSANSITTTANGNTQSWIIEPQLNWERKIAKGQLMFLLGSTLQKQNHDLISDVYYNFPSNSLLRNIASASGHYIYEFNTSIYKYAAVFGRLNYNWQGKYIFNFTGRRDGSSRFGPGKQFANFGAIGAAWIFSEESFIKNSSPFLSFGKLRGSYGVTGSDQIGNYRFLDTYATSSDGATQYNGVTGLDPTRLFNPDYAWESNKKLEGGLELGFLNDRIFLTAGYYRNRSSSQLVDYTLPKTTGFGGVVVNLGATVQNKGLEMQLNTVNIQSQSFKWTTSWNITAPRNKLIAFPNLDSSSYANIYILGKSIYTQKLYEYTGINPETGLYTVKDFNNDGVISTPADNKKEVFAGQNYYGGINNSFTYNGWTLDLFFQIVKQTGYSYWYSSLIPGYANLNHPAFILDKKAWKNPGDAAEIQRYSTNYNAESLWSYVNYIRSDASVSDASFIRLKTVSLSYEVARKWSKGIGCRVYAQGQNLLLITKYQGYDPETQTQSLPPLRTYTAGINLTF